MVIHEYQEVEFKNGIDTRKSLKYSVMRSSNGTVLTKNISTIVKPI